MLSCSLFIPLALLLSAWPIDGYDSSWQLQLYNIKNSSSLSASAHCPTGQQWPFLQLLLHSLLALPVYNVLLLAVGWRLHKSAHRSALRLVSELRPAVPSAPPLPPPRLKRRLAPKPPPRRLRQRQEQAEQFRHLRRDLKRVLEGLQQPLPASIAQPQPQPSLEQTAAAATILLPSKSKAKPRKLLHALFKQLSSAFAKASSRPRLRADTELTPVSSYSIFKPVLQRLRLRAIHRSKFYVPSTSSSSLSSECSSTCLYAY